MRGSQCPICFIQGLSFLQAQDYNRRISNEVFSYYKCPSCGLVYLANLPKDLDRYYPADYYSIPKDKASLLANSTLERYKLELVQQFIKNGHLLEIGPAWGTFAFLAKEAGFNVDVIEMDKPCCDFIQNKLGISVIQSDDPATALAGLSGYDVIALWHVIEHLSDSFAILKAATEKLLPGGVLVVAAPNPASFQFRVLGRFWTHLDAPRHLALIPSDLLIRQTEALGLECVLLTTTDKGSVGWNSFGWAVSFNNFFKGRFARYVAHYAGRILTKLLIPIERSGLRGSAYTAIFQKAGGDR
jgi:2-polyprenyl-3-methyl-5-hydroxy-6-metoxy-1,4-benzoquinol methylase